MIRHLAPVPLSLRNVWLLHQKCSRHDQLTPVRLTGKRFINRLFTAPHGAEGKKFRTGNSKVGGDKVPSPSSSLHLSSRFARRCYQLLFLLLTHLPLSRIYSPESKGVKRVGAGEQVRSGVSPGQVRAEKKSPNGVCVRDLGLRNKNTRDADHAQAVDMTEVGQ